MLVDVTPSRFILSIFQSNLSLHLLLNAACLAEKPQSITLLHHRYGWPKKKDLPIAIGLGLWCLTLLSTIFQLYRGGQFLLEETGVPEENHRPVASDQQTWSHNVVSSTWTGFKLTTLVVIGTDCTGSCKSNYHTITTTMATISIGVWHGWNVTQIKIFYTLSQHTNNYNLTVL